MARSQQRFPQYISAIGAGESGETMMTIQQSPHQQQYADNNHNAVSPAVYFPNDIQSKHKQSMATTVTVDDLDERTDYAHTPTHEDIMDFDDEDFKEKTVSNPDINKGGNTDIESSLFDNFILRTIYINCTLFIFCILSFPLWFGDIIGGYGDLENAYILAAFSIIIIFNASICGLILAVFEKSGKILPNKQIITFIVMCIYFVGAFFYFAAGCQYAQSYNNLGKNIDIDLTSFGGIFWTEMFYICSVSMIAGLDLWKRFLNIKNHRICTLSGLYVFCSMILSFSYLTAGGKDISFYSESTDISSTYSLIGVSYLFGWLISITYLIFFILSIFVTDQYVMKPTVERLKPMIDSIACILLFIFMIFTVMTYWTGQRGSNQESIYYAGFGLFILSMSIMMVFDMKFWDFITKCAQQKDDDADADDNDDDGDDDEDDDDEIR